MVKTVTSEIWACYTLPQILVCPEAGAQALLVSQSPLSQLDHSIFKNYTLKNFIFWYFQFFEALSISKFGLLQQNLKSQAGLVKIWNPIKRAFVRAVLNSAIQRYYPLPDMLVWP